jgi:hypothetical protein
MPKEKARWRKPFAKTLEKWFRRLGALVSLALGLLCAFLQTARQWQCLRASRWPLQPCTILDVKVATTPELHDEVEVIYKWQRGGREITGNHYYPFATKAELRFLKSDADDKLRAAVGHPGGYLCYVNPENPVEAVLCRSLIGKEVCLVTTFQALFIAGGLVLLFKSPREKAEALAEEMYPDEIHRWREDWNNGYSEEEWLFHDLEWRVMGYFLILTFAPATGGLLLTDVWDGERITEVSIIGGIPLALSWWMARQYLRLRRFGKFTFVPERIPLPPGSVLTGTIALRRPLKNPERVSARVTAWKRWKRRVQGKQAEILATVDALVEVSDTEIIISALLPDCPGTTPVGGVESYHWGLHVTAPADKLVLGFTLPVFDSKEEPHAPSPALPEEALIADARLHQQGVGI